jgi:hypothetical protein
MIKLIHQHKFHDRLTIQQYHVERLNAVKKQENKLSGSRTRIFQGLAFYPVN